MELIIYYSITPFAVRKSASNYDRPAAFTPSKGYEIAFVISFLNFFFFFCFASNTRNRHRDAYVVFVSYHIINVYVGCSRTAAGYLYILYYIRSSSETWL